jgi:hypothetical protein
MNALDSSRSHSGATLCRQRGCFGLRAISGQLEQRLDAVVRAAGALKAGAARELRPACRQVIGQP